MKNQIIISLMILFLIGLISAITYPHAFYGTVTYSDGTLIQENLIITARLGDFEDTCIIQDGKYGYNESALIVESETGGDIYFYIQGVNELIETFPFEALNITELNLTTNITNPNSSNESNDSSENNESSDSSTSSGSGGYGGGSFSLDDNVIKLNYKTSSLGEINSVKINETETNPGITGSVIGFMNSGKGIVVFLVLTGILMTLFIIKKYKQKK